MPAKLNKKKYVEVLKIAKKAHEALQCRGVTRSDFKFFEFKYLITFFLSYFFLREKNLGVLILFLINISFEMILFIALNDGEDGIAQSYFEYLKIPYTHSGVISSFNAMH